MSDRAQSRGGERDILARRFRRCPGIVSRQIVEEVLLVPVMDQVGRGASIFALNEVGGRIWDAIHEPRTGQEVLQVVLAEFDVDEATALADLVEFLSELVRVGAVEWE